MDGDQQTHPPTQCPNWVFPEPETVRFSFLTDSGPLPALPVRGIAIQLRGWELKGPGILEH